MELKIINEIQSLPLYMQVEVSDFVGYLKTKLASTATQNVAIQKRKFGKFKGKIKMANDFDKPLDDFKEYES